MTLFGDSVRRTFVLHIPHASTYMPISNHVAGLVQDEIQKMTDWASDKIFEVPGQATIKCEWSRIFCDVERFIDDPLNAVGRGFYYTKTDSGEFFRDDTLKSFVLANYYFPYHQRFRKIVKEKISDHGCCRILDCHTFPDEPLECDVDQSRPRPDICIGTNNAPGYLIKHFWDFFVDEGFELGLNKPYSGSIVPQGLGSRDLCDIHSIMIEINRKLYMKDGVVLQDKVEWLNEKIRRSLEFDLL